MSDEDKTNDGVAKKSPGASRENKDAIPTAGGKRLGEEHWGESGIVPDVPQKRDSAAGQNVSSAEGQPDSQTQSNTAANVGGAASNPQDTSSGGSEGGESKEGIMDKVKDKLGMGQK